MPNETRTKSRFIVFRVGIVIIGEYHWVLGLGSEWPFICADFDKESLGPVVLTIVASTATLVTSCRFISFENY